MNETFCEPEPEEYNKYSANELFIQMQRQQDELLNGIWENYSLSEAEKSVFLNTGRLSASLSIRLYKAG